VLHQLLNEMDERKRYKYHVANHRRINHALDVLETLIRNSIARDDRDTHKALFPLYLLLIGACAEARLSKILMEPGQFSQDEITEILKADSHKEKWLSLIRVSFLKRESLPINTTINESNLGRTAWLLYNDLSNLVENELRIIIEIRNKFAHGQWEYPFTNWPSPHILTDLKISQDHSTLIRTENLLTTILKRNILDKLLDILRDLGVSSRAFPRDYDKYYRRIQSIQGQIKNRSYDKYKSSLINKYQRGLANRRPLT
jgi:hypothetical protein